MELLKILKKQFVLYVRAAEMEHVESMRYLAICYQMGLGVEVNEEKAQELLRRADEIDDFHEEEETIIEDE